MDQNTILSIYQFSPNRSIESTQFQTIQAGIFFFLAEMKNTRIAKATLKKNAGGLTVKPW